MAKITLSNVSTFVNDTSAVSTVNNNMAVISTAMDNTLSRDGTAPNTMTSNLDMNSNQILNLPAPAGANSPARLVDVVSPATIASVPPVGTSGANVGLLNANLTFSGTDTFSIGPTFTTNPTFTTGALQFSGTKVAVNTSPPTKQFTVRSNTTANAQNSIFHQGFQASFEAMNNAGTVNTYFAIDDADSNKTKIGPGYSPGQGLTPFLTFTSTGFAAINTASATSSDRLLIEDGTGANQLKVRYTGKTGLQVVQNAAGNAFIQLADNNTLAFGTNNTVFAQLYSTGGFGVGNSQTDTGVNNIGCTGFYKSQTTTSVAAGGGPPGLIMSLSLLGIYFGSGVPTISAPQGSIYLRSDGSSTSTRLYINTNGSTTWTNVTTAA